MAVQSFGTTHPLVPTQWDEGLEAEVLKKVQYPAWAGKRSDSLIQVKDLLNSRPGDRMRFGLRMQMSGVPKSSTQALTGQEQTLQLFNDEIVVDEIAEAVLWKNVIDRQRVTFDMLSEAKAGIGDFLAGAIDTGFLNQIAGYTDQANLTLLGNNSVTAPDSDHFIFGGNATSEATLDSADTIKLDDIDRLVQKAKLATPAIRPAWIPWLNEHLYVLFIGPKQNTALRAQDSRFDVTYRQILAGGGIKDNPLLTGELPIWNGTLVVETSRIPVGTTDPVGGTKADNINRAVFCGAQTAWMGWGRFGGNPNRFTFTPEFRDFKREAGVAGCAVFGVKRAIFNAKSFASIVLSTWVAT